MSWLTSCEHCGRPSDSFFYYCPACFKPKKKQRRLRECYDCGTLIDAYALRCPACGACVSCSQDFINSYLSHYLKSPSSFAREVLLVKPYWYQNDIFEAVPEYSTIVVLKGRQIGITWSCGIIALWYASTHEDAKILILTLNLDQAQEVINAIKSILLKFSEQELGEFGIKQPVYQRGLLATKVYMKNGSAIEAKGCTRPRADNVRSRRADLKIVDEAVLLYDEMLSAIEPVTTRGGSSIYVSTAGSEGCYFHRTLTQVQEGKIENSKAFVLPSCKIDEDGNISDILCPDMTLNDLKRLLHNLGNLNFKRECCCLWLGATNQIFPAEDNFKVSKTIDYGGRYYAGLDVGATNDPCVFILLQGTLQKACMVYRRSWRSKTSLDKIAMDISKVYAKKRFKLVIDQTGRGFAMVRPLKEYRVPFKGVEISRPRKNKYMFSLSSALESVLKVPQEYHQTLYELRSYYGEQGKGTNLFNFFSITTDHDVDTLSLAWSAIPKTKFPRGLGGVKARERRVFR